MDNRVDQSIIKEYNKKQIMTLLQQKEEMVKRDLAKTLGVSVPTVISNINELICDGIVEEAGVAQSTGGRKPIILHFLKNSRFAFGVDLLIGKVKIVLMNLNFEIICDRIFEFDMSYKIDDLIGKISDEIKKIMTIMNIESEKIIGIGFSLPGMVNEETKMLEIAANLGVSDVDFNRYTDMFDFPVFVENESNAAAYAEYKVGVCRHRKDMVYISVNEGVGAGVIADNKIYKGFKKRAGEIGHMTIYKHGLPCVCGRLGCWNAYVSTYALLNAYISAGGESITTLREFFVLYHEGNVTAVNIWEKYVEDMSVGIQNVILIFDPHYIVIGGEIANYSEELLNPLKKAVFKGNGFVREQDVSILISELKEDASSIGAALIPLNKFMDVEEIY